MSPIEIDDALMIEEDDVSDDEDDDHGEVVFFINSSYLVVFGMLLFLLPFLYIFEIIRVSLLRNTNL